jgi:hypothetical protein
VEERSAKDVDRDRVDGEQYTDGSLSSYHILFRSTMIDVVVTHNMDNWSMLSIILEKWGRGKAIIADTYSYSQL